MNVSLDISASCTFPLDPLAHAHAHPTHSIHFCYMNVVKYYPLFCKTYLYYSIDKVQLLRLMLCSHQPISTFITTSNLKLPALNRCRNGWCWCELESVLRSAGANNTTRKHFWCHSFQVYSHYVKSEILFVWCDWRLRQQCDRNRSDTNFA